MKISDMPAIVCSFYFLCLISPIDAAGNNEPDTLNRESFINTSLERLEVQVPSTLIIELKTKTAAWENNPTEANWIEATDEITLMALEYGVVSEVTIMTIPNEGATIKYQIEGQRRRNEYPMTAKQLTTCIETMPIGIYYIWAERKGKPTCATDQKYRIVNSKETVQISEENEYDKIH